MKEMFSNELKCIMPFQFYHIPNVDKHICGSVTDGDGKNNCNTSMNQVLPCLSVKQLVPSFIIYLNESCNLGLANRVAELGHMMGHWKHTLFIVSTFVYSLHFYYYNSQYSDIRAITTTGDFKSLVQYPLWLEVKVAKVDVKVDTEYKVYDFTGILGSVGGSLGLFIGFSFLDAILCIINKAWSWCNLDGRCWSQTNIGQLPK